MISDSNSWLLYSVRKIQFSPAFKKEVKTSLAIMLQKLDLQLWLHHFSMCLKTPEDLILLVTFKYQMLEFRSMEWYSPTFFRHKNYRKSKRNKMFRQTNDTICILLTSNALQINFLFKSRYPLMLLRISGFKKWHFWCECCSAWFGFYSLVLLMRRPHLAVPHHPLFSSKPAHPDFPKLYI